MYEFKDMGYNATLKSGKPIRINNWPIDIALGNLTLASRILGPDAMHEISKLSIKETLKAVLNAKDHEETTNLIIQFCCCAVLDGKNISKDTLNTMFEGQLHLVIEIFTHVVHSQYASFFAFGLAEEVSQADKEPAKTT